MDLRTDVRATCRHLTEVVAHMGTVTALVAPLSRLQPCCDMGSTGLRRALVAFQSTDTTLEMSDQP
jgi:hypothetical protein